MRRCFLVELDIPDHVTQRDALVYLYDCMTPGNGIDLQGVAVQPLRRNQAVFASDDTIALMLPILPDPPRTPVVMTVHTEPPRNWIQPGVARVNVVGYLALEDDIPLPTDDEGARRPLFTLPT